jgi:hypothetical protein
MIHSNETIMLLAFLCMLVTAMKVFGPDVCLWEFTGDILQVVAASGTIIQSTKVREKTFV